MTEGEAREFNQSIKWSLDGIVDSNRREVDEPDEVYWDEYEQIKEALRERGRSFMDTEGDGKKR